MTRIASLALITLNKVREGKRSKPSFNFVNASYSLSWPLCSSNWNANQCNKQQNT